VNPVVYTMKFAQEIMKQQGRSCIAIKTIPFKYLRDYSGPCLDIKDMDVILSRDGERSGLRFNFMTQFFFIRTNERKLNKIPSCAKTLNICCVLEIGTSGGGTARKTMRNHIEIT
jgi:hypothetical protein